MKSISEYTIKEKNFRSASLFGVFIIIFWMVAYYAFNIAINPYKNPVSIFNNPTTIIILYFIMWIIIVLSVIWTYRIAKALDLNTTTWTLLSLIAPAIGLLFVSFKNENYEDDNVKEIIETTRGEYNSKYAEIMNNYDISEDEKEKQYSVLKSDYTTILHKRLMEARATLLIDEIKLLQEQEQIDNELELDIQHQLIIRDMNKNLGFIKDDDSNACPACNAFISKGVVICSECELIISSNNH